MYDTFFVSDIHGRISRYEKLFEAIIRDKPKYVFLGGDLLPFGGVISAKDEPDFDDFIRTYLMPSFAKIREMNKYIYPKIFLILGNDDPRIFEPSMIDGERANIWYYINNRKITIDDWKFYGYSFIPPTPFMLKDWEKYDVSRYVDPGCSHPYEGSRTSYIMHRDLIFSTIKTDLDNLIKKESDLNKSIFLFHAPPYQTNLDRAALDGHMVDHAPIDVHIGSVAIKKFIQKYQPYITMHGHVHESTEITGKWIENIGNTHSIQGAHKGDELAIIKFNLSNPAAIERVLI